MWCPYTGVCVIWSQWGLSQHVHLSPLSLALFHPSSLLLLLPSHPHSPTAQIHGSSRETDRSWLCFRNINHPRLYIHMHTNIHSRGCFSTLLRIGLLCPFLLSLSARLLTHCHVCTYYFILHVSCFISSFKTWYAATSHIDGDTHYYSSTSIVMFYAQKKKKLAFLVLWSSQGLFPRYKLTQSSLMITFSKTVQCSLCSVVLSPVGPRTKKFNISYIKFNTVRRKIELFAKFLQIINSTCLLIVSDPWLWRRRAGRDRWYGS